jgi:8-oxo-dGTP pyrophosphatase MutT (NUDIX family)
MPDRSSLESMLRAHVAGDSRERAHRDRMLELLRVPGDPFARDHFVPGHFTASSFVLSPDRERLLLIEHAKLKRWLQPGGHVEPGDADILSAARRELREETGIDDPQLALGGIFDLDVHAIPPYGTQPEHEHFDVRFLFCAGEHALRAGSDARAARWVPLALVNEVESDHSIVRALGKLQRTALDRSP